MSFSIEILPLFDFKKIRIIDESNHVHIDIVSKGGLLNSWVQHNNAEAWDLIDGNNFEQGWNQFETNGFKSGKMNPFSCRLNKGSYTNEGVSYRFNKFYLGAHALHGLIYDAPFEIVSTLIEKDKATVRLNFDYEKSDPGFPFEYRIQLLWTLWENNKVTVETTIINKENHRFPMMDGWHPYFTLGNTIDDCTLQFKHQGILDYNEALIPTGKLISNTQFNAPLMLDGIELDNGFLLDPIYPSCILENHKYKLVVTPSNQYPYLQLYTPPGRKSIAIENLSGAPDCFNNKMGLHIMQPQEIWKLETSYQLFIL
jgi:aldose 1-epimerase